MATQHQSSYCLYHQTESHIKLVPLKVTLQIFLFTTGLEVLAFRFLFPPYTHWKGLIRLSDESWTECLLLNISPVSCPPNLSFQLRPLFYNCAYKCLSLKVATPHRPQQSHQPLDKHRERISHLATH